MSERDKLLPCPFCGWDQPQLVPAVIEDRELIVSPFVRCLECGAVGPPHEDGDDAEAVKLWNRRASTTLESEIAGVEPTAEADHVCASCLPCESCGNRRCRGECLRAANEATS